MNKPQAGAAAFDVVVVGSLNLDLVATADRLPRPGETVHGTQYAEVAGGKGLNQAVAAARSGATVAFVGAVGGDQGGVRLRAVTRNEGIDDTRISTVASQPSGRALIAVDRDGENSIVVVAGANALVSLDQLPSARVVLAQLETNPDVVLAALRAAREAGSTTILNPAPADRLPDGVLQLCDIVVLNEHEVEVLGGVDALADSGVGIVVVTRGAMGVDVSEPGATWHIDADSVEAVDTTGAGDAFCGTLTARLAAGAELADAVRYAAAAGALAATRHGAVPSLPRLEEIEALVDGRRLQRDLDQQLDDLDGGSIVSTADVVADYLASFSTGDPETIARHVTEDFVNDHASALGSRSEGRDEYRRRLPGFLSSFPGLRYDIERIVAEGPHAAAAYRMRATSDGWPIDIRGVMLIEVRHGKVARRTDYWDALTFLNQTGREVDS
jgi:ribokinase